MGVIYHPDLRRLEIGVKDTVWVELEVPNIASASPNNGGDGLQYVEVIKYVKSPDPGRFGVGNLVIPQQGEDELWQEEEAYDDRIGCQVLRTQLRISGL